MDSKISGRTQAGLNLLKLAIAVVFLFMAAPCAFKVGKALADETFKTAPGMKFKAGLMCDHPAMTLDLIRVIHDQVMYRDYFHGYAAISGRCTQTDKRVFTLKTRFKTTNVSYDGYRSEMWEVEMEDGAYLYAIIWPDVASTMPGTDI